MDVSIIRSEDGDQLLLYYMTKLHKKGMHMVLIKNPSLMSLFLE